MVPHAPKLASCRHRGRRRGRRTGVWACGGRAGGPAGGPAGRRAGRRRRTSRGACEPPGRHASVRDVRAVKRAGGRAVARACAGGPAGEPSDEQRPPPLCAPKTPLPASARVATAASDAPTRRLAPSEKFRAKISMVSAIGGCFATLSAYYLQLRIILTRGYCSADSTRATKPDEARVNRGVFGQKLPSSLPKHRPPPCATQITETPGR